MTAANSDDLRRRRGKESGADTPHSKAAALQKIDGLGKEPDHNDGGKLGRLEEEEGKGKRC